MTEEDNYQAEIQSHIFLIIFIFIYLFGCAKSQLWHARSQIFTVACRIFLKIFQLCHAGSLVGAYELLVAACGIQLADQGFNQGPLHWECGVLAIGPPGKSQSYILSDSSPHILLDKCYFISKILLFGSKKRNAWLIFVLLLHLILLLLSH